MELFGHELTTEQIIDFVRMQAPITRKRRDCYDCLFIDMALALADEVEKLNRRAAPENKALTLDELRQMDGEPVWIVINGDGRYGLLTSQGTKHGIGVVTPRGDWMMHVEDHGKTWLAYARRPEDAK